jgi:hypothetical protein
MIFLYEIGFSLLCTVSDNSIIHSNTIHLCVSFHSTFFSQLSKLLVLLLMHA